MNQTEQTLTPVQRELMWELRDLDMVRYLRTLEQGLEQVLEILKDTQFDKPLD